MRVVEHGGFVELAEIREFDLARIFECGQCFRWSAASDGAYIGVAMGKAARIFQEGGSVFISGTLADFNTVWRHYFDLDRDYEAIRRAVAIDPFMTKAAAFGAGIRILRQDKWEALASFILSQCNNIPRIKKIIDTLCRLYGEPVDFDGRTFQTFPSAEAVASLSLSDLEQLRCGYRAPFLIEAARAVASGDLNLEALSNRPPEEALAALKSLAGVGDKVASCVVLFGLHRLDAFPVDTWIRKTVRDHYGSSFDPAVFGQHAGIAQQYMFFYARSNQTRADKMLCETEDAG
ncbi:DNA-3-methyladenine glycosylase 2 family protein [Oscillospiraceae bacterium CM]|nr:DNA-3-methyladenine glycosylase 2 family protein [Oscillospiraceae bacterium CM]